MSEACCIVCGASLSDGEVLYCEKCMVLSRAEREKAYQRHYYKTVTLPKRGGLKGRKKKERVKENRPKRERLSDEEVRKRKYASVLNYQRKHYEWHLKYNRIARQRRLGNIICFWCEQPIPEEKLKKSGRKHPPKFCSQACATEKKRATGTYQKMSRSGIQRQMEIKRQTGKRPGYEGRSAWMRKVNDRKRKNT